ncbi:hypothetical protein BH10ACI4_BH10ACI4_35530 [soil metagenome]
MKPVRSFQQRATRFALALLLPGCACAQQRSPADSVAQRPALAKNPTFLFRTLSLNQDWSRLADGTDSFTTTVGYIEPFLHARASLGVSLPYTHAQSLDTANGLIPFTLHRNSSSSSSSSASGSQDPASALENVTVRAQAIPYLTPQHGVLLIAALSAPTTSSHLVGTGKWTIAPSVAFARFPNPRLLVAQFFQQEVSFAGSAQRSSINRTNLDAYMVYSSRRLNWWVTSDINLRIDEAKDNHLSTGFTAGYGRGLRKMFGGSLNGSIQAGAGIGRDRPHDTIVSGGISLVGIQRNH